MHLLALRMYFDARHITDRRCADGRVACKEDAHALADFSGPSWPSSSRTSLRKAFYATVHKYPLRFATWGPR